MFIFNLVCMGKFFFDCIIWEYCKEIWDVFLVKIFLDEYYFEYVDLQFQIWFDCFLILKLGGYLF